MTRQQRMDPGLATLALTLLLALQALTTDLYLPTLALIGQDLHAPARRVQLTMSALMLSFGLAQLVWGPVCDRWGRRPVLANGLLWYLLASLGAVLAPSVEVLIGMRVLQGVGMAAAVVCGRAMVRDLYAPHEGAHVMSKAFTGLGVIAVVSPTIGGGLAALFGWRGSFGFLAVVMVAYLVFFRRLVPETLTRPDLGALRLGPLWQRWRRITREPLFWAYGGLSAASFSGVFVFLSSASYIYMSTLGLSPMACGAVIGSNSLVYIAGTWQCRRWLARHGMAGAVQRGALFTVTGGVAMAALAWADVHGVAAMLLPQWLFAYGHGTHQSCGQAGAVGPFPQEAGTAAALAGFLLAGLSFGSGLLLGHLLDGTVRPVATMISFWALVTSTVAWTLVRRHGRTAAAPT